MIVRSTGLTSELAVPLPAAKPRRHDPWPEPIDWLVLSSDRGTRDLVLGAIRRRGANGHAGHARAAPGPAAAACRYRHAFIDLVHPVGDAGDLDAWVRGLRLGRSRLVVRGGDGSFADELWAREAGAVAYLPGDLGADGVERLVGELAAAPSR